MGEGEGEGEGERMLWSTFQDAFSARGFADISETARAK